MEGGGLRSFWFINFLVLDCRGGDFLGLLLCLFVVHHWSEFVRIPCYICCFSRLCWCRFHVCYRNKRSLHSSLLYFYVFFSFNLYPFFCGQSLDDCLIKFSSIIQKNKQSFSWVVLLHRRGEVLGLSPTFFK
jgi:hypothetical protein